MTREQIEKIATDCGVEVSYAEQGKGGFIIDSSKEKRKSLTDITIQEIKKIKVTINNFSSEEFDEVLFECGIERIKPSIESDYVNAVSANKEI